jgi:N4-gp56 family major capsid protein
MPDAVVTTATTNFNKTVQELISRTLEELLRAPLPHLLPDSYIHATHVAGSNSTMRYLNVPDITVDDAEVTASLVVAEGSPNDTDDLTIGYEEFSTRQRMKTLKFTDVALLQNPNSLFAIGAERLARYVLELADKISANKWVTGTNYFCSGTSNTVTADVAAGDVLLSSDIKKAVALLEGTSVPRFGGDTYRGVIHPYVKFDVELDDDAGGWIDANRYAGAEALFSGELGKYAGVRFMSSPKAAVKADAGTGSIDVYSTTIFGPRFFALGDWGSGETFVTPPGGHDDPGHQSSLITWKGWLDAMIVGEGTSATNVSDARYIRIESASSL